MLVSDKQLSLFSFRILADFHYHILKTMTGEGPNSFIWTVFMCSLKKREVIKGWLKMIFLFLFNDAVLFSQDGY